MAIDPELELLEKLFGDAWLNNAKLCSGMVDSGRATLQRP